MQDAEEALDTAETEAAAEKNFNTFKTQSENIQAWIKEQRQKLLSQGSHMQFEERSQVIEVSSQPPFH